MIMAMPNFLPEKMLFIDREKEGYCYLLAFSGVLMNLALLLGSCLAARARLRGQGRESLAEVAYLVSRRLDSFKCFCARGMLEVFRLGYSFGSILAQAF